MKWEHILSNANSGRPLADDVLKAVVEELVETEDEESSESEDDEILDIIEEDCDVKELGILDMFYYFDKQKRNSIRNYLDEVVPSYSDEEFRHHFRISKNLYKHFSERFEESEVYGRLRSDKRLSAATYVAVFCGLLAMRRVASETSLIDSTWRFRRPDVIKWPNEMKKEESAKFFDAKCGFPKVIGCIDGTYIVIDPPKKSKEDYIDRKGNVTQCKLFATKEKNLLISSSDFPDHPMTVGFYRIRLCTKIWQRLVITICWEIQPIHAPNI